MQKVDKTKLASTKGKIGINDGIKVKFINKEDLQMYLDKGYKLGYPSRKGEI